MQCERKTKGDVCGGLGEPVVSESGDITWGWKCQKCHKFSEKCQGCGRIMRVLSAHIEMTGDARCAPANQLSRTASAVKKAWAKNL